MNADVQKEAIFGAFDGVVSVLGFVFGLAVHHWPRTAIAVGGLGGTISASISMGTGEFASQHGVWRSKMPAALAMGIATAIGSLVPVWPFFVFSRKTSLILASIGCLVVAAWIGYEKRMGPRGYLQSYLTLVGAAALTLLIVGFIPQSSP